MVRLLENRYFPNMGKVRSPKTFVIYKYIVNYILTYPFTCLMSSTGYYSCNKRKMYNVE